MDMERLKDFRLLKDSINANISVAETAEKLIKISEVLDEYGTALKEAAVKFNDLGERTDALIPNIHGIERTRVADAFIETFKYLKEIPKITLDPEGDFVDLDVKAQLLRSINEIESFCQCAKESVEWLKDDLLPDYLDQDQKEPESSIIREYNCKEGGIK